MPLKPRPRRWHMIPRLVWPDGQAIYQGTLYISIGQWHLAPGLHGGKDLRKAPYLILKIPLE